MANTYSQVVDIIFAKALMALRAAATMPALVLSDFANEAAQQGDTINVQLPPSLTVSDVTPSSTPQAGQDTTRTVVPIVLNKWRKTEFYITDKQAHEMADGAREGDISAAMGVLAEDVNSNLLLLGEDIYGFAGAAGTPPFATDLTAATQAQQILFDQKCPGADRHIVLSSAAQANAMNLRAIQDASFRGGASDSLKSGKIGTAIGFDWNADQQVKTHTAGTSNNAYLINNGAGYPAGTKTVTVDTGSGTILAGDILVFGGVTGTYVVISTVGGATVTSITFEPGLAGAVLDNATITGKATHVVNLAFNRNAFALATRPLAPADGFTGGNIFRSAVDPQSGLALSLEISRQNMQNLYLWSILYGCKTIRRELACRIAG